jgi:putative methylase
MNLLVRKKTLELLLQRLKPHPSPKAWLEQYTIPADVAVEVLFIAGVMHKDIVGKRVVDLGCGTGRLALGAMLMGASEVYGVDVDPKAVEVARWNQHRLGLNGNVHWIASSIECLRGRFDTVIQNPPFGVRKRGADRVFVEKALEIARVVYSLHKHEAKSIEFIKRMVERGGGRITGLFRLNLRIPWMFEFHHKKSHVVKVDLYRVERV